MKVDKLIDILSQGDQEVDVIVYTPTGFFKIDEVLWAEFADSVLQLDDRNILSKKNVLISAVSAGTTLDD